MADLSVLLSRSIPLFVLGVFATGAVSQTDLDPSGKRVARAKDGWVVAAMDGKGLWFVDAQGNPTDLGPVRIPEPPVEGVEPEPGAAPSFLPPDVQDLLGTPSGFAVALLQGVAWYGEGAPTHLAKLREPKLGPAGDRVVAAGTVPTDERGDVLHVAEVGADGAWVVRSTGLRGTSLGCVRKVGERWYVMVDRALTAREAAGGAEDPEQPLHEGPVKEIWTSTDGTAWRRCTIPDAVRNDPVAMTVKCIEFGGSIVVFLGNTVLRATAPETFEAFERVGEGVTSWVDDVFVVGDEVREFTPGKLLSSKDLRTWTVRAIPRPFWQIRLFGVRDNKLVALTREAATGRLREWSEEEFFAPRTLPVPQAPTLVDLGKVTAQSLPTWDGARLLLASNESLHESLDGAQWQRLPWGDPRSTSFPDRIESRVHGERTILWARLRTPQPRADLRIVPREGATIVRKLDFHPVDGAGNGKEIVLVAEPLQETYGGAGRTLRISRDDGASWSEVPSPVDFPRALQHGPHGWLLSGSIRKGKESVDVAALSVDLATWRMLDLPNANNTRIHYLGDRLVALSYPNLRGIEEGAMVSVSEDARSWTTRTLKGALAGSIFVVGKQAWLQGADHNWASLDGTNWHRMPAEAVPMPVDTITQVGGVWFVRTARENPQTAVRTEELWRLPAVTDAQVAAAPRGEAPRFQVLTPEIRWARAVAEADAAVTLAKTWKEREEAVRKLGTRWSEAFPQDRSDQVIKVAESWYARLLWYQFDDTSVYDGFLAAMSFLPTGDQEMQKRLLAILSKELREYMRDRARAELDGTPRKLRVTTPVYRKVEPQKAAAMYDLKDLRGRAAAGDAGAMYDLHLCYSEGWGVPVDGGAAQHWMSFAETLGFRRPTNDLAGWRAAAAAGSQYAMYELGIHLSDEKSPDYDPEAALQAFVGAADRGHLLSMESAGSMLLERAATETDFRRTFEYIQRASPMDNPRVWTNLGVLYEQGAGVERDLPKALAYYRRAADAKYPLAMSLLGELLVEGIGVAADRDAGMQMLEAAAQLGNARARVLHATYRDKKLYFSRRPTNATYATLQPPEFNVATRRELAQAGNVVACYDMMRAYEKGLGVRKHLGWARYWAARVVALGEDPDEPEVGWSLRGSTVAFGNFLGDELFDAKTKAARRAVQAKAIRLNVALTVNAAMELLDGMPTPEERREALELLSWAAEQGCHRSLIQLADMHMGLSKPNPAQALPLYERAAALGSVVAAYKAAFLGVQQGMDPDRAMQLYLQAAYMEPLPFDGAADTPAARAAHRLRECERILAAARIGRKEAVQVAAALMCRPPAGTLVRNPEEGLAMAWAARALPWPGYDGADPLGDILKDADPKSFFEVRGSALAHELNQRLDRQLGKDDFAARVAASAPERSLAHQAVAELLVGKLDGVLAQDNLSDNEILRIIFPGTLRAAAARHPDLRGKALLHAMAGVPAGDADAYRKALLRQRDGTDEGLLLRALLKVEVVRLHHGIGCKADPVSALSWHFMTSDFPDELWRGIHWMASDMHPAQIALAQEKVRLLRIEKSLSR